MDLKPHQFIWAHLTTQIPEPAASLEGCTVLVTGSNQGLGFEVCVHVAKRNAAKIIIASRDEQKCKAAAEKVYRRVPTFRGKIEVMKVDMASFESVRAFAKEVENKLDRLDVAMLNAGVTIMRWTTTGDGYETVLQVNAIATGLLALLLLPTLQKTAKLPAPPGASGDPFKPHLNIVASEVHHWAKFPEQNAPSIISALNDEKKFDVWDRYNVSKLLDVFITREIAQLPAAQGIVVNSANPGLCKSNFRDDLPWPLPWIMNRIAWSTSFGARGLLSAAVSETKPGAYVSGGKEELTSKYVVSEAGQAAQKKLWSELVDICKKVAPETASVL